MRSDREAMMVVRSELCGRLDALRRPQRKRTEAELAQSLIGIRRLAAAYGLTPVVRLSEAFERAMLRRDAAGPCQ